MNREYPPLIRGLLTSGVLSSGSDPISVRETHISWVLLTGQDAYKIKKPVQFGFVDFSTLERRKQFCEEELQLNRRYSFDLYLDVIPITGSFEAPQLAGTGPVIEYALRMRQFDEGLMLSNLMTGGKLTREMLAELAKVIDLSHRSAPTAGPDEDWGSPDQVLEPVQENFIQLGCGVHLPARKAQLQQLEEWSLQTFEQLRQTVAGRKADGHVRECHGDLHLGNIILWNSRVTPFDCLEFNPAFRWIDTLNEAAFIVMDLARFDRSDLAAFFLNAFLERSGDYAGIAVFRFYLVYRALVRAKVALLRREQMKEQPAEREQAEAEMQNYLDLATRSMQPGTGQLFITHGLSGSGKTWGTQKWIESLGAIRIRSDVERKRIFGIDPDASQSIIPDGLYSSGMTQKTYDRLASLAKDLIQAGYPVIVDATFLRRADRLRFQELAKELNVPFQIIVFDASAEVLRDRIQQRARAGGDASDATVAVMEAQRATVEPLIEEELRHSIRGKEGTDSPPP